MRAFVGEPGAEHRETLRTASAAAAAGGVTTIVSMPDTNPVIDDPAIVDFVLRRARDTAIVHVRPAAALTKGLGGREMTEIGLLARGRRDRLHGRRALRRQRAGDAPRAHLRARFRRPHHPPCRGPGPRRRRRHERGRVRSRLGLAGIPREAETVMLERDIRLVRLTGGRYHAAMISCADSVEIVRAAKARGLARHLRRLDQQPRAQRERHRRLPHLPQALAAAAPRGRPAGGRSAALAEGVIDVIVSDHNPQDVETKRLPFAEAADGAVGLETLLSAALRLVHAGDITLAGLLRALSTRPAEILGLPGGRLATGAPADLIAVRPRRALHPRQAPAALALEEHALRRGPPGGQVHRHPGCGPDRVRPARRRG